MSGVRVPLPKSCAPATEHCEGRAILESLLLSFFGKVQFQEVECRVQGIFRVLGAGFRVQGSRFRFQFSGFRVPGFGLWVEVESTPRMVQGFVSRVWDLGSRAGVDGNLKGVGVSLQGVGVTGVPRS